MIYYRFGKMLSGNAISKIPHRRYGHATDLPVMPMHLFRLPVAVSTPVKSAVFGLIIILLAGCKIVVTVPEGGRVITEDGFVCSSGKVCVIEVGSDRFDSTFTAKPSEGYTFTRWARKDSALCSDTFLPCHLSTRAFSAFPALMDILASDKSFHLEPVFVNYDVSYWQQVQNEVEKGLFTSWSFLYAISPSVVNCDPGALTQGARLRALKALNNTRALHKLPPVEYDSFYDMQVQETSLVQQANGYLDHSPSPGDACYTTGAREGAGSSNLSGGAGAGARDPAGDIFRWTNDSNNIAALMEAGHRRWMLYPYLGYISYGQVGGYTALKVSKFGRPPRYTPSPQLEFVATPYRYYPHILFSREIRPAPWSLSIVPPEGVSDAFDYFPKARVKVIKTKTGASLPVKELHRDSRKFGLANFLSWKVDGWEYDTQYTVKVSNIRMPGGETRDIEYPVVVDRYHLINVDHPREAKDKRSGDTLSGRFDSTKDKDSYKTPHYRGRYRVTGRDNFSGMGFFILVYDRDKRLLRSSDKPFVLDFPPGAETVVISPCNEKGRCYQGRQTYSVTFSPQ